MTVTEQQAQQAQQRYLELLRRRVAWQAGAAYGTAEAEAAAEPQRPREPHVEPVAPATAPSQARARALPTLWQLESLVAAHGGRFPEREPEWRAYLFQLRQHADARGRLPESLGAVVETAFAELLGGGA